MAADDSIIVLDDDDDNDDKDDHKPSQPSPSASPPGAEAAPAPVRTEPEGARGSGQGSGRKSYKVENERLFAEFLELCRAHTADHPEVVPFLHKLQHRAQPPFLASAEFCNILSRVLSRAQSQPTKPYVYINELCTVLKARSARRKLSLAPAASASGEPSSESADPAAQAKPSAEPAPEPQRGSRRQVQRLEQLLALYVAEIRRLQEKELDLLDLDDPDSTYLQEARLKRKLIRLFRKLCELKDCSSLTGRVIEQRIPYRGTRYPEVNRSIERLINRPGPDAFPDYGDVLRAVERAAARHGLGLPRPQLQLLAQDAFRDVGVRLQERRHLDLIYNFGCHLTDDYRPGVDPALTDPTLARRLRENRVLAMSRLDAVISKYAVMQERSEEEERQKRRARHPQGATKAPLDSGEGPSGVTAHEGPTASKVGTDDEDEESEEEEDDDEDEEEEVTDSEEEEDLEQLQEGPGEDEEEEDGGDNEGVGSPRPPSQTSTEENLEPPRGGGGSSGDPASPDAIGSSGEEPPPKEESPAKDEDVSSSDRQPEESGRAAVTSTSFNGAVSPHSWAEASPPRKRPRRLEEAGQPDSAPSLLTDSSTRADSPSHGQVTSSQRPPRQPGAYKMSVATQCDPEEIIVLSDSD